MSIIGNPIMAGASGPAASIFVTGLSENDTVTATNGSKTKVGVWAQVPNPESLVPTGYTQLAYLKGDGGQYINVPNFTAGSGITYSITFSTDLPYNNIMYGFFGNSTSGGINFVAGVNNYSSCGFYTYVGAGGGYNGSYSAGKHTMRTDAEGKVYIDDYHFINVPGLDKEYTAAITVFGEAHGSNPLGRTFIGAIYDLLFEKNGNAYMHFVPAKRNSDSVVGMYDIVNGVFYTNSGTGEFVAGPEIPQTIDGFLIKPIRDFGTWTVTATDGTHTKTQGVLVDVITEYEVEISYKTYLYNEGDEFEDVTGGWQKTYFANGSGGTATKNETNLYMVGANASNWGNCGFATVNPISCEGYSKLYILADNHPASGSRNFATVTNGYGNQGNSVVQELLLSTIGDNLIIDASDLLSSLNNKHLFINAAYYTNTMTIHSVWLE